MPQKSNADHKSREGLPDVKLQKNEIKTQMRTLLEKADSEKRSLTDEEGTQFDELRTRAQILS